MHVLATAGHVDHGKSALLRALTGMEPDRLAEERRRGLTIELGHVWTTLAGRTVAFVDVPGHERFLATMLAGVGPVPAVLLAVAADGGWSAQTAEHVAALHALGVRHAVVAVTRSDLADPAPVAADVRRRLAVTTLDTPEIVAVSARTGAGLDELRAALVRMLAALPPAASDGPVRLWIDRAFTVTGAGTVVTGTLTGGSLRAGSELELAGGRGLEPVRVRGLQSLGAPADFVTAPARVAVNLRNVPKPAVHRGDALLTPGAALVDVLDGTVSTAAPVREPVVKLPSQLLLHAGAAAVPVRVRRRTGEQLRVGLQRPLPLLPGDRTVLTDPGRHAVVGGFVVGEPAPPRVRPPVAEPPPTREPLAPHLHDALLRLGGLPQPFSVLQARTALGCPRPQAIAVLEALDAAGVTRRLAGNARVVSVSPA